MKGEQKVQPWKKIKPFDIQKTIKLSPAPLVFVILSELKIE